MILFLEQFQEKFDRYPKLMQFDEGGEFLNKDVKPLLESHKITYFSTASKRKASIVGHLNRTVKEKLLKLFEKNQNHNWVDHLDDILHNYNTQINRSIGMTPSQVHQDNKFTVWGRLYGHIMEIQQPKFSVGDKVRVLKFEPKGAALQKYYREKYPKKISKVTGKPIREHAVAARDKPPFSDEVFEVKQVLLGDPVVYKLYSPEADIEILGKFYEDELSLVR